MLLDEKGRAWRREFLRAYAVDGVLRLAGAAAVSLAALLILDRSLSLSEVSRTALLACAVSVLAALSYRWLIRPWRRLQWRDVFAAAARRFPEIAAHALSAWELRGGSGPHTSEELARAHLEQTEALLGGLPALPVLPLRPSRWARRGAVAAVFGGFALPWSGGGAAWQRALTPWRDIPFESLASISPGDKTLEWGKPVEIEVRWSLPADADRELKLWLKTGDGTWQSRAWDRSGP